MVSVIIQGPLQSRDFNTITNINGLIDQFGRHKLVDQILLTTWSGKPEVANKLTSSGKLVFLQNVSPNFRDNMNRYKQFYSVYNAAMYIQNNSNSKYIFKIRTDQSIDSSIIDYLYNFLENSNFVRTSIQTQENYIVTSHSYNPIPFFVGDFYFGGTVNDILSFTKTYAKYQGFCHQWLPEVDITLKYLYDHNVKLDLYLYNLRGREDISDKEYAVWQQLYTNLFSVFPESFFNSLVWRGKPYQNAKHDYFEQWETLKNNPGQYILHEASYHYTVRQRGRDIIDYLIRKIKIKTFQK